eukprot:1240503-Rhodomonas_salina.1
MIQNTPPLPGCSRNWGHASSGVSTGSVQRFRGRHGHGRCGSGLGAFTRSRFGDKTVTTPRGQ